MRVYLVDGTYELFRMYYGAPSATTADGGEVGATRALLRSLDSLRREGATHVACAFDHVVESFRNELFDGYKTGEGIEKELLQQFPLAERAARALGYVVWPMVAFEADDALATAAARWADHPAVEQIRICSPDKDLAQCVRGERVVQFDRRRRTTLDDRAVMDKYGVPPEAIPDYLALVGDSADGIPGVPRWGAKSTALLLRTYGSLAAIPRDPARWTVAVRGAASLAASLREHEAQAQLYLRLTTLRTDVPLDEELDDLRWNGVDQRELGALSEELEDTNFQPLSLERRTTSVGPS
jgi:5'-3' exonuclease